MEKEKVKVFGEGEHLFLWKRRKRRGKRRKIFGKVMSKKKKRRGEVFEEGKYIFCGGEEKGRWKRKIYFLCVYLCPLISLEAPRDLLRSF